MRIILKFKWVVLAVWIAVIAALLITSPNITQLVHDKGKATIPKGYSSTKANQLLTQIDKQKGYKNSSTVALVFHREHKLSENDYRNIKLALTKLKSNKKRLGIDNILNAFDEPDLKNQLVSKDGRTVLMALTVNKSGNNGRTLTNHLYAVLKNIPVPHYYTSSWMVDDDMNASTQAGLHKTEWITVVFILAILLVVFRSVVAPFIPLLAVGISFIVSQCIIAFFVNDFNFPISDYTQIFLVAILFGIGTDYCILLLSRFKEELIHHESVSAAIIDTYKTAGRTVFFSGLAVFIGFSVIGLSTFKIFQSAVGVAIGVLVLLIALGTIVPFFMAVLGHQLFWPSKKPTEHRQNWLWGKMGRFALTRTIITFLIIAGILGPILFFYKGTLSFNTLSEISDQYRSVKGFNLISAAFDPGEAMPTQIVLKNDERLNTPSLLQTIEGVTREVKKVDHVKTVRSVTQPTGKPIKDFFVANQAETLKSGLNKANQAVNKISGGLGRAHRQLTQSAPKLAQATDGMNNLIKGTNQLQDGANKLSKSLGMLEKGAKDGTIGIGKLQSGANQIQQGAKTLSAQSQKLQSGYRQIQSNLNTVVSQYQSAEKSLSAAQSGLSSSLSALGKDHPDLQSDPNYLAAVKYSSGLAQVSSALGQLNSGLTKLNTNMGEANQGLTKAVNGQKQLSNSLGGLSAGVSQLQTGLSKLASGQQQIAGKLPAFTKGIASLSSGQTQLKNGFAQMNSQMKQLTKGLGQSSNGLEQVSGGLTSASHYLADLSSSNPSMSGFYIPDDALKNPDFTKAMDTYMSPDRKMTTLDVIFDVNPYDTKALNQIPSIKSAVKRAVKGTRLENAKIGVGGITSTYADLRDISHHDYNRTVTLMLIGIGLIMIALFRSLVIPLYVIASLITTYFASMSLSEILYVNILGYPGISWAVPFFAFVVLVTLGVDYSIFLIDRFNEYRDIPVNEAILSAMKNMGSVILSAAVILSGTFAAMIPSGVMTLIEVATIVIVGLFLYNAIMLPLFIPMMVKIFGTANWWPFKRSEH